MAQRRMFNISIINSAKFLKMPIDAQNLYFHLGLRADDDGIVEAFTVMRQIGSNEDNLRVLSHKEFIRVLNEDLVSYIMDWNEHNIIRPDRKIDSIYKDLLVQLLPNIKLIESKERADRKKEEVGTSHGQPMDGIGKVRLGKVKLGKVSIVKESNSKVNGKVNVNSLDKIRLDKDKIRLDKINTFGEHGWIKLSLKQFEALELEYGIDKLNKQISQLDEYIQANGNKNKYKDWNLVLKKSIRDNWFNKQNDKDKSSFQKQIDVCNDWLAKREGQNANN